MYSLKNFNIFSKFYFHHLRKNKKTIDSYDFEMASERVLAGLEKKKIVSEEERRVVAVHESGHAVVSWFLEGGHPLLKVKLQLSLI
jgi:AFG3 family protein